MLRNISTKPGGGVWGGITGTLAAQTDLSTALADKVDAADLSAYAPLASPALTGTPTAPTQVAGNNSTRLATTAFVVASFAPLASPALTGVPTAPTPSAGDNSTKIATTAYVDAADSAAVKRTDVHDFPALVINLLGIGESGRVLFAPNFAGTLTRIRSVLFGDAGLDDTETLTTAIAGVTCTGGSVSHAGAAAEGDIQTSAITAGGAFSAGQIIEVRASGTNITTAWAGVTLSYTRT